MRRDNVKSGGHSQAAGMAGALLAPWPACCTLILHPPACTVGEPSSSTLPSPLRPLRVWPSLLAYHIQSGRESSGSAWLHAPQQE